MIRETWSKLCSDILEVWRGGINPICANRDEQMSHGDPFSLNGGSQRIVTGGGLSTVRSYGVLISSTHLSQARHMT